MMKPKIIDAIRELVGGRVSGPVIHISQTYGTVKNYLVNLK